MALFFDGPVSIDDAINFVREVPIPSNNALTMMFPRRDVVGDELDFTELTITNRVIKFRTWDGAFKPVPRDTGLEKRVKMPPLGGFLEVGEYERRQIEFASSGGTLTQRLVDAVYNDLANLTRYAYNRIELAWGDLLTDGKLTISENGLIQEIDYGLAAGQNVTPGVLWSTVATADPLANLIAWNAVYAAANGGMGFGRFLTTTEVVNYLISNTKLINAIRGSAAGVTMVSIDEINRLFNSFGLPSLEVPTLAAQNGGSLYNSSMDVDGVTTRVLAANKFLALPADLGTLGTTAWGMPTTAMDLAASKNVQVEVAPGLVGILDRESDPPYRKRTYVDGVGMPALVDVKKLFVATVA
jgi:hypothetical protein